MQDSVGREIYAGSTVVYAYHEGAHLMKGIVEKTTDKKVHITPIGSTNYGDPNYSRDVYWYNRNGKLIQKFPHQVAVVQFPVD